jgi:hypothetical protein
LPYALQHRVEACARRRVRQVRVEVEQRPEDEGPLRQTWVRYLQAIRLEDTVAVEGDVKVDRPGRPARGRPAAEVVLDLLQVG